MPHEFPTSRLLVTLGWAKSGEEAARQFTDVTGRDRVRERGLRRELRRATRGLKLIIGELHAVAQRDEVLPPEPVELMGLLVKISDAILRSLMSTALASETRAELHELEDAVAELDDLVEDQQLAAEIPGHYKEMAVRVADLYGSGMKPTG